MTTILVIFLLVSVLFNIIMGVIISNLKKQIWDWEKTHNEELDFLYEKFDGALSKLHDADINGAFESDDEVGAVFTEIKEIIQELSTTI